MVAIPNKISPVNELLQMARTASYGGCDYDGYIIAIVYSDGGYDIIAEGGSYSYAVGSDGQGQHKYDHSDYCGKTPWSEFIGKYIEK